MERAEASSGAGACGASSSLKRKREASSLAGCKRVLSEGSITQQLRLREASITGSKMFEAARRSKGFGKMELQVPALPGQGPRDVGAPAPATHPRSSWPCSSRARAPQMEFDTHDEKLAAKKLRFLQRRSRIVEVVGADDLIFALTQTGMCAAINRGPPPHVCSFCQWQRSSPSPHTHTPQPTPVPNRPQLRTSRFASSTRSWTR